ncbi:DUF6214 family protein [Streptomyces libani]|uniref:DUF6214 family protein n=1 Tax=Streptomyces nigrescens TaxID=1920 RepID=UPI0037FB854A
MEWPTWELQAHGSAAPAPDPAAPDDPAGSHGPGCPLPRLDPLGPWCSARLTFADGARVDVLVTVSDDHITVEDVRADPPLTLDGLADLARWIEGPLDDAFRAATGRPRKTRPTPRQAGPADATPERDGGPQAGPQPDPARGAAPEPMRGPRPSSPHGPTGHPRPTTAGPVPGHEPQAEPMAAAGAGAATAATERATPLTGEAGEVGVPGAGAGAGAGTRGAGTRGAGPTGVGPMGATGLAHGEGVLHRTATGPGTGCPADPPAAPPTDSPVEQTSGQASEETCERASGQSSERTSGRSVPSAPSAPSTPAAPSSPAASPTPPDASAPSPPCASATPAERARSAVLARTRTGERRKIAADAYRQAQREGRDPVLAVMLATGRNRRRSLRLIAGARDEGLLTPRHNKR